MTNYEVTARPIWVGLLVAVQAPLAVIAIPSGALFLADPTGRLLAAQFIQPYLTKSLPFIHDFVPVGIWLVAVYGALPIVFDVGLLRRVRLAWLLTIVLGLTVVAWIAVEMALFRRNRVYAVVSPDRRGWSDNGFRIFHPFCEEILLTPIVYTPVLRRHSSQTPDGQHPIHASLHTLPILGAGRPWA
jgi:hypothetical protein